MADRTKIEWTATTHPDGTVTPGATWNPVTGCSIVSPGCTNCYAMRTAWRQHHGEKYAGLTRMVNGNPVWTGTVRLHDPALDWPFRKRKPLRIFVNSMSDLFHEDLPDEAIDRVFAVMALCPQHTFLVLTKRAQRMRDYFKVVGSNDDPDAAHQRVLNAAYDLLSDNRADEEATLLRDLCTFGSGSLVPLPNVWFGVSVEDQVRADERIPLLLATPAAKRFISAEPLLGPVRLSNLYPISDGDEDPPIIDTPRLDWVIAGGESGPGARPMHPQWARDLRDQCQSAGVAFFFKQWGSWGEIAPEPTLPGSPRMVRAGDRFVAPDGRSEPMTSTLGNRLEDVGVPMRDVGKKAAGRLIDGREWSEFPDHHSPAAGNPGTASAHR